MQKVIVEMPYDGKASVNAAYRRGRGRGIYMVEEAKTWKLLATLSFISAMNEKDLWFTSPNIHIELDAYFPKQVGRKPDASNFLKLFEDSVAEALQLDDHTFITGVKQVEHNCEEGRLVYTVYENN